MSDSLLDSGISFGEDSLEEKNEVEETYKVSEKINFVITSESSTLKFHILKMAKRKSENHVYLWKRRDCSTSLILDILRKPVAGFVEIEGEVYEEFDFLDQNFEYELLFENENIYYLNIVF